LIAQFLTLFGGILIGYQRIDSTNSQGIDVSDSANTQLIGVLVVVINCMTLVWPLVRKILVGKHIEYYEKVVWILGCLHGCYMSYCGGEQRAAAARERAKEALLQARASGRGRRASELRRDPSMADMMIRRQPSMRPRPREVESTTTGMGGRGLVEEDVLMTSDLIVVATDGNHVDEEEQVALQQPSRDLALARDHSDPDTDRALFAVLEEILDRMGPKAALQTPLPFATLMKMLQLHIRDLDQAYLRKLFDQCDTNQVHVG
jgi:hypothetical protein